MKECRACGVAKPLDEFYRHATGRDGHRNECKPCRRAKSQRYRRDNYAKVRADTERRRAEIRAFMVEAKSKPCADCGQSYPHYVMDFHHERDKEFLVSRFASTGYPLARIQAEIEKCALLCANCHRLRHGGRPGDGIA